MEATYRKQFTVDDREVLTDIFDTAGQEDFSAVRDQYMRTGDGFICVYAVTLPQTFESVKRFRDHILRVKDCDASEVPFVVAGNKADLEDMRIITKQQGEELANDLNVKHFETSAKTKLNVAEVFTQVAREIVALKGQKDPEEERKPGRRGGCVIL
eukprot:CAMPEP_0119136814 /NCGR_PEP_ID=MMETSP1310-20130426/22175_1 /TAXON_ID=464262 /ORGANISM="Genus nov. species nov., Strain RCC2339" /LENGTH=155 /DNA_ID=CAMNT_0007127839 /DNA_START=246 /DNA_END=713 /DNA_ORIENTATION=+